jgi:hypothetical protein
MIELRTRCVLSSSPRRFPGWGNPTVTSRIADVAATPPYSPGGCSAL